MIQTPTMEMDVVPPVQLRQVGSVLVLEQTHAPTVETLRCKLELHSARDVMMETK